MLRLLPFHVAVAFHLLTRRLQAVSAALGGRLDYSVMWFEGGTQQKSTRTTDDAEGQLFVRLVITHTHSWQVIFYYSVTE